MSYQREIAQREIAQREIAQREIAQREIAPREIETIYCYTKPGLISSSRFAPKEVIIYKVPTLDECIGMLPKVIGNYILSFTPFWIEFYLQNIQQKYGNKFLIEMIDKYLCCNNKDPSINNRCCGRLEFRGRSKLNQGELINKLIFSIITNYREKKNIPIAFQCCLENKCKMIVKKENILSNLIVGDILRDNSRGTTYVVVYVEEKNYKVCLIGCWRFENEYYIWLRDNKIRKESKKNNKLIFSERLSRKRVKSHRTMLEIDFTKPVAEIYYQI
jgi:hypothetical protein